MIIVLLSVEDSLPFFEQAYVISSSGEQYPSEDNPVTSVLDLLKLQLPSDNKQKGEGDRVQVRVPCSMGLR